VAPAPRDRGLGRRSESYLQRQMCCNPLCSKLPDARISRTLPRPHPARRPEPAAGDPQRGEPLANAPPLPAARPSAVGWRGSPEANSQERGDPGSRPGRDRVAGDRPPARRLGEILAISCPGFPSSPALQAAPRYLRRSRARPRSAPRNPNPCCGAAGRASRAARPSAGRRGWRPGSGCRGALGAGGGEAGVRRLRPGDDSAETSAARAQLPSPAGRCLRARRARGGGWGAREGAGRREGLERPAPRGSRLRAEDPGGGASSPSPQPHARSLDLGGAARVCCPARPSPFPRVWPSLQDLWVRKRLHPRRERSSEGSELWGARV
jgi:hypothetical protein